MNYSEPNRIYENATDNDSYHGGYSVEPQVLYENPKYLGGNTKNTTLFQNMVVPFGLFYENYPISTKGGENSIEGGLIQESRFNELLLSVGKIEKTGGKQKTRKNYSSK